MPLRTVDVRTRSGAPPQTVFRLLTDGASWVRWTRIARFELERPAPDRDPGGVGAVRVFRTGPGASREEVVEIVEDRRFSYRLLSGFPVRDYRADVDLDGPPGGGTTIRWHSTFLPRYPGTGWFVETFLRFFIGDCARGLAAYAESVTPAGPVGGIGGRPSTDGGR